MSRQTLWRVSLLLLVASPGHALNDGAWWSGFAGNGPSGAVQALLSHNGELIVMGDFTNVGGMPANHIAAWDGQGWRALGSGLEVSGVTNFVLQAKAMATFDGYLVVGGAFNVAGGVPVTNVARWDGTSWSAMGELGRVQAGHTNVRAFGIYGNQLIAVGDFRPPAGGSYKIARWTGFAWQYLTPSVDVGNSVNSLTEHKGKLVLGGFMKFTWWDGLNWGTFGTSGPMSNIPGQVYCVHAIEDDLFLGGAYANIGLTQGVNNIARWDGLWYYPLGYGMDDNVHTLTSHDGELVAGGIFEVSGGKRTNYVARWDGSTWNGFGSGISGAAPDVMALASHDGSLYVGGVFESAGGISSPNIARWISVPTSTGAHANRGPVVRFEQVQPNPFNPATLITYSVRTAATVAISVYDMRGRVIATLERESRGPGTYAISWDGHDSDGNSAPSGTYVLRLAMGPGRDVASRKIVLVR